MDLLTADKMSVDGTVITIEVGGREYIADLADWDNLIKKIGGAANVGKAELQGDLIEFPNNTHVEVEDIMELAEKQNAPDVSAKLVEVLSDLTTANNQRVIDDLMRAFAKAAGGNKVYMRDLRPMLEEKFQDLSNFEVETLYYLIRDLKR